MNELNKIKDFINLEIENAETAIKLGSYLKPPPLGNNEVESVTEYKKEGAKHIITYLKDFLLPKIDKLEKTGEIKYNE